MAAIVNDRDLRLQGTVPRAGGAGQGVILTGSSTAFYERGDGTRTPLNITLEAIQLGTPSDVTWTITGGVLGGAANSSVRTLTTSSITGEVATITAKVTKGGTEYSSSFNVYRLRDGTTGSRGAGHFYVVGSSWSDIAADIATPGDNVIDDVVTISSGNFVMEKKWSGSAWVAMGTVLDGSLLVSESVTAAKINSNGLTIRDNNGNVILGVGSPLNYATWLSNKPTSLAGISASEGSKLLSIDYGATAGATFGVNIGGQITSSNASTYIASAAIGDALIGSLSASKIQVGLLTGHTYQSASTGRRVVINSGGDNLLTARNESGAIMAQIGSPNGSVIPAIYASQGSGSSAIDLFGTTAMNVNGRISTVAKSGGDGTFASNSVVPVSNNTYTCGHSSFAWSAIYSATALTVTSDERAKDDIEDCGLGMNLVRLLRAVTYRLKVGEQLVAEVPDFEGPLLLGQSAPTYLEERAGARRHYGLLAQQVKAALDQLGIDDAAFWVLADKNDPDSGQSLRYEELIAVLIKALQQIDDRQDGLEARLAALEAKA